MEGERDTTRKQGPRTTLRQTAGGPADAAARHPELPGAGQAAEKDRLLADALLHRVPMPIALLDREFNFLRVNRAYAAADEREPGFYPGKNHFALYPNPEKEEIFRWVLNTGQPYSTQAAGLENAEPRGLRISDGDWALYPACDRDGAVAQLVLMPGSATAWLPADRAQPESEVRLRDFFESVSDGLWMGSLAADDRPGSMLYTNTAFRDLFGLAADGACDYETWLRAVHPHDRARVQESMRRLCTGQGGRSDIHYRTLRSDGSLRWLSVVALPMYDAQDRLDRVAVLARDITERKVAGRRLHATRMRLARRVRELTTIHTCSRLLGDLYTPQALAQALILVLERVLAYDRAAIWLLDEATGGLKPFLLSPPGGAPGAEVDHASAASQWPLPDKRIADLVAETGKSVRLDARRHPARDGICSELCVPLRFRDKTLGVISVQAAQPGAYSAADQRVLEVVATQVAVAIENARLYERERQHGERLEQRVVERTAALSSAIQRLTDEVAERHRAEHQLDRSNRLMSTLNRVGTRAQAGLDLEAVLEAVGTFLKSEGLDGLVLLPGADPGSLVVQYAAVPHEALALYQEVTGFPLVGSIFPASLWPFSEILARGQAMYGPELWQTQAPAEWALLAPEFGSMLPTLRLQHAAICAPFAMPQRGTGVLAVWGAGLREQDVPAFSALAGQLARSLERLSLSRQASEVEILRRVDRLRSELIANVSHEIRTPLGMIDVLCTSLLAEDVAFDAETQRSFLEGIKEATDRLAAIVENLLHLSRAEGRGRVVHRHPVDFREVAEAVVQRTRLQSPHHSLLLEAPDAHYVALIDSEQMERVLSNLLSNAVKYSPEGGEITVTLAWQEGNLVLSVRDRGIGIAEEEQERIFERFYRVDNATSRKVSGTGLGLAVCRSIVEAHGGRIWVSSRPGMGSTFFISLPVAPPSPELAGGWA